MTKSEKQQKQTRLCELCNELTTAFCGLFCLQGGRIGGGAFISQWKRWRGVFAPSRENENKTIHSFFVASAMCVGELCR